MKASFTFAVVAFVALATSVVASPIEIFVPRKNAAVFAKARSELEERVVDNVPRKDAAMFAAARSEERTDAKIFEAREPNEPEPVDRLEAAMFAPSQL
ncbi:hypothetical protein EUX98_g1888 [Antrodiella citrinella]|uniref:Uncharacterized protein n=1 Tax=Antrodiella citrinella TaxID=2447956 RepID=A0A4V3XJ92_9APHY|nr:hypothetical protein EUX98_g1888 [Antrodiella citrinella]